MGRGCDFGGDLRVRGRLERGGVLGNHGRERVVVLQRRELQENRFEGFTGEFRVVVVS